jgi:hypothetical protein
LKNFGVKRQVFESEVLKYGNKKSSKRISEKSDEYKLNKYALKYIKDSIDSIADEGEKNSLNLKVLQK